MHVKDMVRDIKHWMSFIPYKPVEEIYRVGFMAGLTIPPYELPDGTKINNNEKICTAAERWFIPSAPKGVISAHMNSNSSSNAVTAGSSNTSSTHSSNINNNSSNSNSSSSNGSSSSSSSTNGNSNNSSNSGKGTPGFPPSPLEVDCNTESLQGLVHHCLSLCDTDVRRDLLGNIVIVGGGSLIDGVSNRLLYELNEILPSNMKVRVCARPYVTR
jgi:actin-related protein